MSVCRSLKSGDKLTERIYYSRFLPFPFLINF